MKISFETLDIWESGCINSNSMEDLAFHLSETPPMKLIVRIKKNDVEQEPSIEVRTEKDNQLIFIFTNPAKMLNFGLKEPAKIGKLSNRELFVSFRINIIDDYSSYQISYTFYLGKEDVI